MVLIRKERPDDAAEREALLDAAFGDHRWRKTSQRLRDGRTAAAELSFVATDGKRIVGTARLWDIICGSGAPALLLGPVAVAAEYRNRGIGAALVRHAIEKARRRGHRAVILVGDASYYGRFGFSAEKTGALRMPGPFERDRLLGLELVPGALGGARGLLRAAGRPLRPAVAASAA
ncbi:MAG TPA: N-acetyltransferase [Pseudolabrys sp.]|nr:N-acetyltransferase [Pseudolabrys sp.]